MNFYLLAPEISLLVFALLVILLDLITPRKAVLAGLGIAGLIISSGLSLSLWGRTGESIFNGMLVVDEFSLFFKLLFSVIAVLVILASTDYVSKFSHFQGEYYALVLLSTLGMMLLTAARELISIYVALEVVSLSLYALASFLKDPRSSEAGLKYFLLGAIASAVLLYGMALVFGLTGKTQLQDVALALQTAWSSPQPALLLGTVFLIAGFGFKIASVPFQMWVPDVYEGAPTPITAYLSVASKAAGFAIILRVFLEALGGGISNWAIIFAVLSALSMTIGNVVAIAQGNIKRMLGYSSIAQAGYLMVGLAAVTISGKIEDFGPTALIFFLASYAVTNLGAFIAVIAVSNKTNSDLIADYSGMGKRAPLLSLALTLCLVSLTGIPPTAGFLAKLFIFNAGVQHDLVWLVIIGVINSVISAYYYLRVVKVMWFGAPTSEEKVPSSRALQAALALSCLGVLALFFFPSPLLQLAQKAAGIFF